MTNTLLRQGRTVVFAAVCVSIAAGLNSICRAQLSSPPHLRKQGTATQLIVDGRLFLILGGELGNSSSSSLEYMQPIRPKLVALNLSVEEGKYVNGQWRPGRWLNGDQTHQGRHLRLPSGRLDIQRIKLYRYR